MSEIQSIPYSVRFTPPLVTARGAVEQRRGFLHGIEYDGKRFVAETALLPQFGTEHFEHAERILNGESMLLASAPATVFGLDCLRYALEQRDAETLRVPVAKLLPGGTLQETIEQARQALLAGFETVKIKVGVRDLTDDIQLVNLLALELPELVLRLDANLSWSGDDVRRFADAIKPECVEWLEDPCRAPLPVWLTLTKETGLPLACDEAFREREILQHAGNFGFAALVLKPARLGALTERRAVLDCMREAEIPVVLSSLIDSSIGLAYLAHLAAEWSTLDLAHGLGTLDLLGEDTLEQGLRIEAGQLIVPPLRDLAQMLKPKFAQEFGWQ